MAATPESKVKAKVVQTLKVMGAYYFYPVTGGFGASGVPDVVGCYNGTFFGIECKVGKNKPTQLQLMNLRRIRETGGVALLVNETTVGELASLLADKTSNVE